MQTDISGQRFNYLTAVRFTRMNKHRGQVWEFRCVCGAVKEIEKGNVTRGGTKSCGCMFNRDSRLQLSGERYEKLIVLERKGKRKWLCQCDCGRKKVFNQSGLRNGSTKSCGCIKNLPDGEPSRNQVFAQMRQGAKRGGRTWEITLEQFSLITSQNCFYCGRPPKINRVVRDDVLGYTYNGIDRVDNEKGYVQGNIVPCCKTCNIAKNANPVGYFKEWVVDVYNHWGK